MEYLLVLELYMEFGTTFLLPILLYSETTLLLMNQLLSKFP